jgi:hypothetical protein
LQERIEAAVDAGRIDADALLAGGRNRDQIDVLDDITRRVGIRDIPGNDRERLLGCRHAGQSGG